MLKRDYNEDLLRRTVRGEAFDEKRRSLGVRTGIVVGLDIKPNRNFVWGDHLLVSRDGSFNNRFVMDFQAAAVIG